MGILLSCSTDSNETNTNPSSNQRIAGVSQSVSDVLEEQDYDTQSTMYLMLSDEDKLALWNYKIDLMITENNLNSSQLDLIEDFKSNLNVDIFKAGDDQEVFKNVYVTGFLSDAELLFTSEDDQNLITNTFYTAAKRLPAELAPHDPFVDAKPCTCHRGSMWSCPAAINCKKLGCSEKDSGCGLLFLYSCNGRCFFPG